MSVSSELMQEMFDKSRSLKDCVDKDLFDVDTYDMCFNRYDYEMLPNGMHGSYVTVEAYIAMGRRFLLAMDVIKLMEENQEAGR